MNYRNLSPKSKNSFSINIYLTTSKFAAYAILIIGSIFGFIYKDGATLLATFTAVSAILMTKTYVQGKTDQATINTTDPNAPVDPNADPNA
jgi:hypothetical protein